MEKLFHQQIKLSSAVIDDLSMNLQRILQDTDYIRSGITRTRLAVEEVLLQWATSGLAERTVQMEVLKNPINISLL